MSQGEAQQQRATTAPAPRLQLDVGDISSNVARRKERNDLLLGQRLVQVSPLVLVSLENSPLLGVVPCGVTSYLTWTK